MSCGNKESHKTTLPHQRTRRPTSLYLYQQETPHRLNIIVFCAVCAAAETTEKPHAKQYNTHYTIHGTIRQRSSLVSARLTLAAAAARKNVLQNAIRHSRDAIQPGVHAASLYEYCVHYRQFNIR